MGVARSGWSRHFDRHPDRPPNETMHGAVQLMPVAMRAASMDIVDAAQRPWLLCARLTWIKVGCVRGRRIELQSSAGARDYFVRGKVA
jgi:hypothetical protein